MTHSRPSDVLVAWLKSTPPGTANSCLASFGPELEPELRNDESELVKEFDDSNDELGDPNDEDEDGNDFDDLNEGAGEKVGEDEKELVLEVKVLVGGEDGLPIIVWK